ncbi:MAG: hypothetical protein M3Q40_03655 [Pseudomonadota bacterium]|nr:hypothetical protein [Pseudomonadota bacterium]
MSKLRSKICAFLAVLLVTPFGWAAEPQLTGPRVVILPHVDVPFVTSEKIIRQGTRDAQTGACVYSVNLELRAGELPAGYKLGRVQRAYDPDTCRELVEEGVVSDAEEEEGALDLSEVQLDSSAATVYGQASASAAQHSATGQIRYTDGNHPLMQALGVNGLEVSRGKITVDLTAGDCINTPVQNRSRGETAHLPATGWSQAGPATLTAYAGCDGVYTDLAVKHRNSGSIPLIFDCSDVVLINYSPLRVSIDISGNKQLAGSVHVSGDMTSCGENLARFETLE